MDVRFFNLKQGLYDPTRRWQQKRHLKSEFTFFQPSLRLFLPIFFIKSKRTPLELNCQDPFPSSKREINFGRGLFTSSIKRNVGKKSKVVVLPCKPIAFLTTSSLSSRHLSGRYLITNMADLLEGTSLLRALVKKRYRKIDRCSTKVLVKMPPYNSKW